MVRYISLIFIFCCLLMHGLVGQQFSTQDSIRGGLSPERTCYDVTHYHLDVAFNFEDRSIAGSNTMRFELLKDSPILQVDLFETMEMDSIIWEGQNLAFTRKFNGVFIDISDLQSGKTHELNMFYNGTPRIARQPPWDGGFIWSEDGFGNPWVAVACEGLGASVWWPNKDHLSDEPDSMKMSFTVPSQLSCVSNGQMVSVDTLNADQTTYTWKVSYPINNYNVTFNIGKYVHFSDQYHAQDGDSLDMDFYVLNENLDIAKTHFKQSSDVLEAFEHYFGKFPFWEDGFALVETPYLGMEHQTAIAYGNKYMRGYLGGMIPPEMNFDYIILHETGHEYFGNAVSCKDHAEMWIHESFTTYMEALFVEYHLGYEAVERYLSFQARHSNSSPIVGPLNINFESWGHSDHYFKGSWVLHTLRHVIGDDEKWFGLLKALYQEMKFKTVDTGEIINFINNYTGQNYDAFFQQYLYNAKIPTLEYSLKQKGDKLVIKCRWSSDVDSFEMPILLGCEGNYTRVNVKSDKWTKIKIQDLKEKDFKVATEKFLIDLQEK